MFRLQPRWRKVLRELWANKTRTLLVVASIAVGIFAIGTVQHLRTVILTAMTAAFTAADPAHATIVLKSGQGVNDELLQTIREMPGVVAAEGVGMLSLELAVSPGHWELVNVHVVDDFTAQAIDRVYLEETPGAAWPGEDELALERSALQARDVLPAGVQLGDTLTLERADGRQRALRLTGWVHDATVFPATFTGAANAYVTYETFIQLGGPVAYEQVKLRIAPAEGETLTRAEAQTVAFAVADRIERSGHAVERVQVPEPGRMRLQDLFDSLTLILAALGLLSLVLSGFLVVNTISALLAQQVRQIGAMKAIGARRGQLTAMYLAGVLIYSLAALAVAVPLTALVSASIARFLGGLINLALGDQWLPRGVAAVQVAVGLCVPLLAALYPVWRGTAITVHAAISDYGASQTTVGGERVARLLSRIRGLSRPVQLSLRNTFRQQVRLALTLITLVMGGMLFMTVGSVRLSLDNLIKLGLSYNQFDVQVRFARDYRIRQIEQAVRRAPGVEEVEIWGSAQAIPIRLDGSQGDPINLSALPAASALVQPTLMEGRWLLPEDQNALVISQKVLAQEPDVAVGDEMVLEIGGRESVWVVVGIVQVLGGPANSVPAYANYPYFARLTNSAERGATAQVRLAQHDRAAVEAFATQLETLLEDQGLRVATVFTIHRIEDVTGSFFDIIIYLLLTMGVVMAIVGALGLMGAMSTNVLERTREIGVMRAIGASDRTIRRIVIAEGICIGVLSWLLGALLAYPTGAILSRAIGRILFRMAPEYTFAAAGLVVWLALVVVLAAIASILPAWNASRLTVREVLAYQ